MNEWFKARNVWYGAFAALTDAEAGRLAKALWAYTATGEQAELSGNEKGCFAMILFTLQQDDAHNTGISTVRSLAGQASAAARREQKATNSTNAEFVQQDDEQPTNPTSADIKNKNKKKINTTTTARAREEDTILGPVTVDPLIIKVQQELNGLTDTHYHALDDYRRELGDEIVSYAIDPAVGHGVRNWSYVEAVLRGWLKAGVKTVGEAKAEQERHKTAPVPQRGGKTVSAQRYEQRDYNGTELEKALGVDSLWQ